MKRNSKEKLVEVFNKAFDIPVKRKPTLLSSDEYKLKFKLLKEELDEYLEACENEDMVEVADAIVDMQYILSGIVIGHGLQSLFDELFLEVHESNMSKLENGKVLRRKDGKVLKGKNYFKPEIDKILKNGRR